jgi:hypothetical protein
VKRKLTAGITSVSLPIEVGDTTSTTAGGLSGLVFNTAGLVAEYRRQGQSSWTAITLVAGTLGTFVSGGFIADGALAGAYEFCPPNAALASGARWVAIRLRGATNMVPVLIEIELDAVDYQDNAGFGLSRLDAAMTTRMATFTLPTNFSVLSINDAGLLGGVAGNVTVGSLSDAALRSFWTRNASTSIPISDIVEGSVVDAVYTVVNLDTVAIYNVVLATAASIAAGIDVNLNDAEHDLLVRAARPRGGGMVGR